MVLISGFESFGGFLKNSSQELIQAMQGSESLSRFFPFDTCLLPVERKRSFDVLARYMEKKSYSSVFLMGMAAHSVRISVEKVAINWSHFSIPDNALQQPIDERIDPGAPDAYFSNMPVLSLVDLKTTHIPIQLSLSAGSYVCNDLYFRTLHWIYTNHYPVKAVFLHLPMIVSPALSDNTMGPAFQKDEIYEDVVQILVRGVLG